MSSRPFPPEYPAIRLIDRTDELPAPPTVHALVANGKHAEPNRLCEVRESAPSVQGSRKQSSSDADPAASAIRLSAMQWPPARISAPEPSGFDWYQPQQMLTTGRPQVPSESRVASHSAVGAQVALNTNWLMVKQSAGRIADMPVSHCPVDVPAEAPERTVPICVPTDAIVVVTLSYWAAVKFSLQANSGIPGRT